MTAALLATAAATGLLGSLHCAGMCGPLVLAGAPRPASFAAYLAGRFTSYALVGALMGALGEHALCRLPVSSVQIATLAAVAAFALLRGARLLWPNRFAFRGPAGLSSLWSALARLLPSRGLGLGLATGFLPCAMLVPAWLLAASSGTALGGSLTMATFFAASAPGLIAPAVAARLVRRRIPTWVQGAGWLVLAAFIAVRPLLFAAHSH